MNFIQDVEKLAELKDKGVLTEDEFLQKKTEILSRSYASPAEGTEPAGQTAKVGTLDISDKLLIEQRVANEKPSQALAYAPHAREVVRVTAGRVVPTAAPADC